MAEVLVAEVPAVVEAVAPGKHLGVDQLSQYIYQMINLLLGIVVMRRNTQGPIDFFHSKIDQGIIPERNGSVDVSCF